MGKKGEVRCLRASCVFISTTTTEYLGPLGWGGRQSGCVFLATTTCANLGFLGLKTLAIWPTMNQSGSHCGKQG